MRRLQWLWLGMFAALLWTSTQCHRAPSSGVLIHLTEIADPPPRAPVVASHQWEFAPLPEGWETIGFLTEEAPSRSSEDSSVAREGLGLRVDAPEAALASPAGLALPLEAVSEFQVALASESAEQVRFAWSDDGERFLSHVGARGEEEPEAPIDRVRSALISVVPDGRMRTYRVPASKLEPWGWFGQTAFSRIIDRFFLTVVPTEGQTTSIEIAAVGIVLQDDIFGAQPWGLTRRARSAQLRDAIFDHHAGEIPFDLELQSPGMLRFAAAVLGPEGTSAELEVIHAGRTVFREAIPSGAAWAERRIPLPAEAGKLALRTASRGTGTTTLWGHPVVSSGEPSQPNVILYMVDSLRADHLKAYGYDRDTSPALDSLADEGALFRRCYVQSSWTRPSVASIFTSRYPQSHGVTLYDRRLAPSQSTLAERFRRAGYFTASFITNPNAGASAGLDRGFDLVFEKPAVAATSSGERSTLVASGTARALSEQVFPWLSEWRVEPFFLYLHSNDPHMPYAPAPTFRRRFPPRSGPGNRMDRLQEALYDADIAANDHEIGELVKLLRKSGLSRNTILAVVSDHGEEFGEHGDTGHGRTLHREVLHVPWFLWAPGRIEPGTAVEQTVEAIDIAPTLLDLAGLLESTDREDISGVSRVPELLGQSSSHDEAYAHLISRDVSGERETAFTGPDFGEFTVLRDDHRLILREYGSLGPSDRSLFDLSSDPNEANDIAGEQDPRLVELLERIRIWREEQRLVAAPTEAEGRVLGSAEEEHLRALGYLE